MLQTPTACSYSQSESHFMYNRKALSRHGSQAREKSAAISFSRRSISALSAAFFLGLAACGGGSSGNDETSRSDPDRNTGATPSGAAASTPLSGGPPGSPVGIKSGDVLKIDGNSLSNHFILGAVAGEKIFLRSELVSPLTDQEKSRCSADLGRGTGKSSYDTQIHVLDERMIRLDGKCGESLVFSAPDSGNYVIKPDYPSRPGLLHVATTRGDSAATAPFGASGSPSSPANAIEGGTNPVSANPFFNYFRIQLNAGDRLFTSVTLDAPMTRAQNSRCAATQPVDLDSSYDSQTRIFSAEFEWLAAACGEYLEFTATDAGSYIIQFDYGRQGLGHASFSVVSAAP